jgi:hypothetical protein
MITSLGGGRWTKVNKKNLLTFLWVLQLAMFSVVIIILGIKPTASNKKQ